MDGLFIRLCASLAQLVEQLTLNQFVRGSSPRRCTTLAAFAAFFVPKIGDSHPGHRSTVCPAARSYLAERRVPSVCTLEDISLFCLYVNMLYLVK